MKRVLIILICSVFISYEGMGQSEEFVKLSDIVTVDGYSSDLLFHNASNYLDRGKPEKKKKKKSEIILVREEEKSWVSVPQDIAVYSASVARHTLGHIKFDYLIEVKDGKYRYTFSDVKFIPYSRNRYGRFEPIPGKSTTLQAIIDNPKYRFRNDILKFVNSYTMEEANRLLYKMQEIERAENDEKPASTDW